MDIDIRAALDGEAPASTSGKCKIQRWLDDIPADAPALPDLMRSLMETDSKAPAYRTLGQMARVLGRLRLATTEGTVGKHRAGRCKCGD